MTLHYESGSSNGQVDLVSKLATFVDVSSGGQWELVEHLGVGAVTGNPSDAQATIRMASPNDAIYFHFTTMIGNARPRMRILPSTGFSSGVIGTSQTGVAGSGSTQNKGISIPESAVTFTYHFCAGPTWLYVFIQFAGGEYQHFSFGRVDRFPGVDNSYWCHGSVSSSSWTSSVMDYTDLTTNFGLPWYENLFKGGTAQQTSGNASIGWFYQHAGSFLEICMDTGVASARCFTSFARNAQTHPNGDDGEGLGTFFTLDPQSSAANIITPLMPAYMIVPKVGRSGWWTLAGAIPGARACWTEAYAENEEIIVGSDKWRIFPAVKSRRIVGYGSARFMGIAVHVEE
jgi:hypothetical protein